MKITSVKGNSNKWVGLQGLLLAVEICKEYYLANASIPKATTLRPIYQAINRGNWKPFGVSNWGDFLKYCDFPVIVTKRSVKINWQHESSLEYATLKAKAFYKQHGKSPRTKDLEDVYSAIYSGYWKTESVTTWNEFLLHANLPKNRGDKWSGLSGLAFAVEQLRKFKANHRREPTIMDFKTIFNQINKGIWEDFGISTWNNMIDQLHISLDNLYHEYNPKISTNYFTPVFEF